VLPAITTIKIKRSLGNQAPGTLGEGELAYTLGAGGDQMFIGDATGHVRVVAGQKYIQYLLSTPGILSSGNAVIVDNQGRINQLTIGNIYVANNGFYASAGNAFVFNSNISVQGHNVTNLANPVQSQDAATKYYVDSVASGLIVKNSCYLATTAALSAVFSVDPTSHGTLTGTANGALVIDGVAAAVGNRILVKNQVLASSNGIYVVTNAGGPSAVWSMSRSADFNGVVPSGQAINGIFTFIELGNTNATTGWVLSTPDPITLNSTALAFTQFSGTGSIQAGFGLRASGTQFSVEVADLVDGTHGVTYGNNGGAHDLIQIKLDPTAPLGFNNNGAVTVTGNIAGSGLSYNSTYGNLAVTGVQPQITTVGNITTGTWNATPVAADHGGTGLSVLGNPGQVLVVSINGNTLEFSDIDGGTF
jgi:hypothetical protein